MPAVSASRNPTKGAAAATVLALAVLTLALFPAAASAVQKIPASRFEPSESCACHAELIQDWSESLHAQALDDPIYLEKLADAERATKGAIRPWCETCHGPVAGMAGLVGKKAGRRPAQAAEGIGCDFCHQAVATGEPVADSSFIVRADGGKRAQLDDAASPVHRDFYSPFHERAEICGTCHDVNHPTNGLPLESTYSEWTASQWPEKGVVCQDCHMTPGPGVDRANAGRAAPFGVERDHVFEMTFVGGNAALGPKHLAEERLRAACTIAIDAPQFVEAGESMAVTTTVSNVGAGHYVPTGVTDLRRVWLEVVATDGDGREVFRQTREFGTEFADAEGRHPAEVWDAVRVYKDDRIPPGGAVSQSQRVEMPAAGPLTVRAGLYYRGVPEALAERAGVEVPVTEMARAAGIVYSSRSEYEAAILAEEGRPPLLPLMSALGAGALLTLVGVFAVAIKVRGRDVPLP